MPAASMEEDAAVDVPAASIDNDAAADALYQEAAFQAFDKLKRAAGAGPVGAASDDDVLAAVARVGNAGAGSVTWEVDGDEDNSDAVVNGNGSRPRGRERPLRQLTRQQPPRSRKTSRGEKALSTKQSASDEGLRPAAEAAGMYPAKIDLSSEEEAEDDGLSAGSMNVSGCSFLFRLFCHACMRVYRVWACSCGEGFFQASQEEVLFLCLLPGSTEAPRQRWHSTHQPMATCGNGLQETQQRAQGAPR